MRLSLCLYTLGCLSGAFAAPATHTTGGGHIATFKESCKRWQVKQDGGNAWLLAYCADGSGGTWNSVLNLNHCIGNDAGRIVARPQGNFANTCRDLHLDAYARMSATCTPGDVSSSLVLNDFIHNDRGALSCFGFRGCGRHSAGCNDKPPGK
ncbi:Cyanovirin-N [Hypoxylon sp. EC38]|nr:Cyanovirin-N [Hypoxylon sp. EC38]